MQTQEQQAMQAIKNTCAAPSLPEVIQRLAAEKTQICSELKRTPASEWSSARFRDLGNREDELHVTLRVLQGLGQQPLQIAEPAHDLSTLHQSTDLHRQ
jgi:hypothetical protein